jgi:4-amino-4-deoxy-L-arabinose transferase-like glycosyltransferase
MRGTAWAVILVAAAVVRLVFAGAVVGFEAPLKGDEADYHAIATHVLHGDGFASTDGLATARRPPAYPVFLAGVYAIAGENPRTGRIIQALLGVAVVALTGLLARQFFGATAALVAMVLAAANPFLIFISGYLLTENLYLLCVLGALFVAREPWGWTSSRARAVWGGALLGLATLARPTGLPMFEWVIAMALLLTRVQWRTRVARAALCVLAFALVVLPWYARNASVVGGWVLTTHGGITFLQGNNEKVANTPQWRGGAAPLEVLPRIDELSKLDELSRDRLAWDLGRNYLITHPTDVPGLVFWKMVRYWRLKSDMGLSGIRSGWWFDKESVLGRVAANVDVGFVYAVVALPLFIAGLMFTRHRWRELSLLYGVVVVHTAVAAVFYGSLRSRIPIEPVMCMFAASAAIVLARRVARPLRASPTTNIKARNTSLSSILFSVSEPASTAAVTARAPAA